MSNSSRFLDALIGRDWGAAGQLLAEQPDLVDDVLSLSGQTPLLLFMRRGDAEVADWLLSHGANGSVLTNKGQSAAHLAVAQERDAVAVALLEVLDRHDVSLDRPDKMGVRPLHDALGRRTGEPAALWLIDHGADPDAPTIYGTTPLMAAATFGKQQAFMHLAQRSSDLMAVDSEGRNVVHSLLEGDRPELVSEALGVLPDEVFRSQSRAGATALTLFAKHIHRLSTKIRSDDLFKMLDYILSRGADPNHVALEKMHEGYTVCMILAGIDASEDGRFVQRLLSAGADPNARGDDGTSALGVASSHGHLGASRQLVLSGASPDRLNRSGVSPYLCHMAMSPPAPAFGAGPAFDSGPAGPESITTANGGGQARAKTLADWHSLGFPLTQAAYDGPATKPANDDGDGHAYMPTPLAFAIRRRDADSINQLLVLGADPAGIGPDGSTALHALVDTPAIDPEFAQTTQMVLAQAFVQKANRQAKQQGQKVKQDQDGSSSHRTPTATAVSSTREPTRQVYEPHADPAWRARVASAEAGWKKVFDALTQDNPHRWNEVDGQGQPPLVNALKHNHRLAIDALLSLGDTLDPTACTHDGMSPVLAALAYGHADEFVKLWSRTKENGPKAAQQLLLQAVLSSPDDLETRGRFLQVLTAWARSLGPEALAGVDADGNTAVLLAAATEQADVVETLLALGADPDVPNRHGETALMHATVQRKGDIIRYLRAAGADPNRAGRAGRPADLAGTLSDRSVTAAMDMPLDRIPELEAWPVDDEISQTLAVLASTNSAGIAATTPRQSPGKTARKPARKNRVG